MIYLKTSEDMFVAHNYFYLDHLNIQKLTTIYSNQEKLFFLR